MKRVIVLLLSIVLLVACGIPKKITYPNKYLKYENDMVTYKGTPYSGIIKLNLSDKKNKYGGAVTLKNGHLDGLTRIKSRNIEYLEISVKDKQYDGVMKLNYMNIEGEILFVKGLMESFYIEAKELNSIMDLKFNSKGKLDGKLIEGADAIKIKDGVHEENGIRTLFSIDKKTGDLKIEVTANEKIIFRQQNKMFIQVNELEKDIFTDIFY